jgi:hypothetical protein
MAGRNRSHSEERWVLLPETIVRCNGTRPNGGRCKREAEPGAVVDKRSIWSRLPPEFVCWPGDARQSFYPDPKRDLPPRTAPQSPRAGSRRTRRFHARGSAAHRGSAGWQLPHRRQPAICTPVRSLRRESSILRPPSLSLRWRQRGASSWGPYGPARPSTVPAETGRPIRRAATSGRRPALLSEPAGTHRPSAARPGLRRRRSSPTGR